MGLEQLFLQKIIKLITFQTKNIINNLFIFYEFVFV